MYTYGLDKNSTIRDICATCVSDFMSVTFDCIYVHMYIYGHFYYNLGTYVRMTFQFLINSTHPDDVTHRQTTLALPGEMLADTDIPLHNGGQPCDCMQTDQKSRSGNVVTRRQWTECVGIMNTCEVQVWIVGMLKKVSISWNLYFGTSTLYCIVGKFRGTNFSRMAPKMKIRG